jgi:hypothetical protein
MFGEFRYVAEMHRRRNRGSLIECKRREKAPRPEQPNAPSITISGPGPVSRWLVSALLLPPLHPLPLRSQVVGLLGWFRIFPQSLGTL